MLWHDGEKLNHRNFSRMSLKYNYKESLNNPRFHKNKYHKAGHFGGLKFCTFHI